MAKRKGSIGKTLVWILMALLFVSLLGFGATSFSGGGSPVARVGGAQVSAEDYARALQNEINAVQSQTRQALRFQEAQQRGIPDQVLAQLVVQAALENEADEIGLSVGDERLAQDVQRIPAFAGSDGSFSRDAYGFALQNAGISEAEFEEDLRNDSARALLQSAVIAGIAMPDSYIETVVGYIGERRAFTYAQVPETLLLGVAQAEASEADLRAWYDDNIDRFTDPEAKMLTYVWLTPDMILDSVEVDEAAMRAAYEERFDAFNLPERRLVERLVYGDTAAAEAALARVTSGEATFEDLVAERGLDLSDTDMGDVAREALGAAADVVFGAESGAVVGPAPTDLGPALFRINGVLAAQNTSFEEAQPALRDELALDRARRDVAAQVVFFDEQLAGGATLEELADETDMRLDTIAWSGVGDETIAGYEAFRAAAQAVTESDFPEIIELGDGGVAALRMDALRPAAPRPFEDVAEDVRAGWNAEQRVDALVREAENLEAELGEGRTFEAVALEPNVEAGLTRNADLGGAPREILTRAFEITPGDLAVIRAEDSVYVMRLDEIIEADLASEEAQLLSGALTDQASGDIANDLFRALSTDIQTRAGVEVDRNMLNAVHVNFQ